MMPALDTWWGLQMWNLNQRGRQFRKIHNEVEAWWYMGLPLSNPSHFPLARGNKIKLLFHNKELEWDMEMKWATFIDRNGVGCVGASDRCRVLVPLCRILFTSLIEPITNSAQRSDALTGEAIPFFLKAKAQSDNHPGFSRVQAGWLKCVWVFDAAALVWYFCSAAGRTWLCLGHWWKGMETERASSLSEGIVCVIGLSKCFISRAQNGCVKFAAQALLIRPSKKSILLQMSGSRAWNSPQSHFALLCISYLNEKAYWCGSHWAFRHGRLVSFFVSIWLLTEDFEVWH